MLEDRASSLSVMPIMTLAWSNTCFSFSGKDQKAILFCSSSGTLGWCCCTSSNGCVWPTTREHNSCRDSGVFAILGLVLRSPDPFRASIARCCAIEERVWLRDYPRLDKGLRRKSEIRLKEAPTCDRSLKMSTRHRNQLPHSLPQLQNLIKRDPASYKDEVR